MFSFLKRIPKNAIPLSVDVHSHLLPGLDDGVKTIEEAKKIIDQFIRIGYSKLIITPHIMSGRYDNNATGIHEQLTLLKNHIHDRNISIQAAAEYYLDEVVWQNLNANKPLMTFGENYLLFELGFFSKPYFLNKFIALATAQGYKPVLAHPERYHYFSGAIEHLQELREQGVLFQINIPSIVGAYSKAVKKTAVELIHQKWVDFLGSDCHNVFHMSLLVDSFKNKHVKKALELPLLNRNL